MIREKLYPNYKDVYHYNKGDSYISLKRYSGNELVYQRRIPFDTSEDAKKYFYENCGE